MMSTTLQNISLHMINNYTDSMSFDRQNIWHPYTSMANPLPSYYVHSAKGVRLTLSKPTDETPDTPVEVIDGMSSWWAVIHGYNHPAINQAMTAQINQVSHVMFGGMTHQPAIDLCQKLVAITPKGLDKVFISDSGSVAVEVAIKMAMQYWKSKQANNKTKLLTVRNGYHGDTFAAMSVCDPVNGMHQLFEQVISKHYFAPAPATKFDEKWDETELAELTKLFEQHHQEIAAFIIEPIVQGAGGMRIYHPNFLKACRALCDKYNVLLIADEIATGFGRTGKLFACEWSDITPDILCVGKALTGGNMSLAATLCSTKIATTISEGEAGCFMHGPTFMGNPLACAAANASLSLLATSDWQQQVTTIEQQLTDGLLPLANHRRVADTRVLGAIGVIEANQVVNMAHIQKRFVELGVWIRPFGKLIYIMPPFVINKDDLTTIINAITTVLDEDACFA